MNSSTDTLFIVIPAYNEEENITNVIHDWYPIVEQTGKDSRLIIIDDGSKDQTFSMMQEYAKNHPQFLPLTKANSGHGATVLFGYRYALEHGADYVFQTDSDGQTLPSEFPPFWNERELFDMLIGHRNKREDGFSRVFVTKTLKLVIRMSFGVSIIDANTPYRLLKAKTLQTYLPEIPTDFNLSNVLLSVIYAKHKREVKFIPITFRPRQGGVNSINMKRIFKIGKQAWKDFRVLKKSI